MKANRLDGLLCSKILEQSLQKKILLYTQQGQRSPTLAVLQLGDNPASTLYIQRKKLACQRVGIHSHIFKLSTTCPVEQLIAHIQELNNNPLIDGIFLQLPLPKGYEANTFLSLIDPYKDVDGLHPLNMGALLQKKPFLRPCTPYGIIRLLEHYDLSLYSQDVVIIGSSTIVGRPMALECLLMGSTPTICHRATKNLKAHVEKADILIVAAGQPHLIPGDWIKKGAIVVDVGITRLDDGTICGDVDFESAEKRASWISPVPGGVGPMTIAMLLENTLRCYEKTLSLKPDHSR
jgi:methylenetetrahydrofolate dehydrogenase (NADP+) / methenyltetrahydrofolate cyclohydrolase